MASENQNYADMLKVAQYSNSLTPDQQDEQKIKQQMLSDYSKALNYQKIISPVAGLVDFISNTYRGGKVGGGSSDIQASVQNPYIKEQANLIGQMGKTNPSTYTSPLIARQDKLDRQDEIDADKDRKFMLSISKAANSRYDKSIPDAEIDKFNVRYSALKEAFQDGSVGKVDSTLTQFLKEMGETGNIAMREREFALKKNLQSMVTSTMQFIKSNPGDERYSKERLQPIIDIVNSVATQRKVGYEASLASEKEGFDLDPTYADYGSVIEAAHARKIKKLNSMNTTPIEYKGLRWQNDKETTSFEEKMKQAKELFK